MKQDSVICIGVCTIQRPELLEKCLLSLAAQEKPDDAKLYIVVVDNDSTPSSESIVARVRANCPHPTRYLHEPRRGIPVARNRVLEEAATLDADWVAFIDDDQFAAPTWIKASLEVARRDAADIVKARVNVIFPEPLPFWCIPVRVQPNNVEPDGPVQSRRAATFSGNGVLISARLTGLGGYGLRYNERLAVTGGEEREFCRAADRLGAVMVFSNSAVVTEEEHRSRCTYRRFAARGLTKGGRDVTLCRNERGYPRALLKCLREVPLRTMHGILQLFVAPLFLPFDMNGFKHNALQGGRRISYAVGALGGLLSLEYGYYRQIDGH